MENVYINNLCKWNLYFRRITSVGDVKIPASAKNYPIATFDEIYAQIQNGNVIFTGTDGLGNHARVEFVDDNVRKRLFGMEDASDDSPVILNEESVKELLAIKTKSKFNEMLKTLVQTDAEKRMLVEIAFKVGAEDSESWKVDTLREIEKTVKI